MDERQKQILEMDEMDWRIHVDERMRQFEKQTSDNFSMLKKNTEITQGTADSVSEMLSVFNHTQTGIKVFSSIGNFITGAARKWWPVVAFGSAVWAWFHGGNPPKGE